MIQTNKNIAGIDEAGRGPWFGPVFACAALIDRSKIPTDLLNQITDSKKLSEKKREDIFDLLLSYRDKGLVFGLGQGSVAEITEHNILQATFMAMARAVQSLSETPTEIYIDGNKTIPEKYGVDLPMTAHIKGDGKYLNIAVASIIAKVSRDRYIREIAQKYPQYGLEKHKGYGTKQHQDMIRKYGPCPEHRLSFKPFLKA
ncbi:MAG: ribonuclease HII [Alphaproteobacteria bacterium]|nr:ribonuclease HII [Alphaproteobacteria bacterium]MBN2779861.1 ribonuclease HII [Alphaproteobacteria bacterium]